MSHPLKDLHARRRMDNKRIKQKAARVAKSHGLHPEHYLRIADHLQTCSGPCCGNRRKYEGKGLDEIRHMDSMKDAVSAEFSEK